MFSVYKKSGLRLAYPENWELLEEESSEAELQVTLSSPATAFWVLAVYSWEQDLEAMVDQVVSAMREEYPDLEVLVANASVTGEPLVGRDVNFLCLDLTNTSRIRACHDGGRTLLMIGQAEDRELAEADPIFEAMTESLLRG